MRVPTNDCIRSVRSLDEQRAVEESLLCRDWYESADVTIALFSVLTAVKDSTCYMIRLDALDRIGRGTVYA